LIEDKPKIAPEVLPLVSLKLSAFPFDMAVVGSGGGVWPSTDMSSLHLLGWILLFLLAAGLGALVVDYAHMLKLHKKMVRTSISIKSTPHKQDQRQPDNIHSLQAPSPSP
jgi:hypothetical protein